MFNNTFSLFDLNTVNAFFDNTPYYLSLGVLIFFLYQIVYLRKLNRKTLLGGIGLIFLSTVAIAIGKSILQYYVWSHAGELSQAFLPPTTPISYYLGYVGWRFWLPSAVTVAFALLFLTVIYIVRKNNSRFFFEYEEYVAALAVLIVGWPHIILYVPGVLFMMVLSSLYASIFRGSQYTPFVFLWLPLALIIFFIGPTIFEYLGWTNLYVSRG